MNGKFWFLTTLLLLAILVLSACSPIIPETGDELSQDDLIATQSAEIFQAAQATATTIALQTQIAQLQTQVAAGPTSLPPTATPLIPTATPLPPTATPLPPTPTAIPPTATPSIPCNAAAFVADVTVPDGTVFQPGAYFTKTWRLQNTGSCTWTTAYDIVLISGDLLGAPSEVAMPANVAPGQVVDVSVGMTAPGRDGSYRGNWRLRDAGNVVFGVGQSSGSFYVDIQVSTPQPSDPYNFASSYCSAEWTTGAGRIPCNGSEGDSRGYVKRVDKPVLETGYIDDEPALITHPQMVTDGIIRGKYPAVRIGNGYYFTALIGCVNKATGCDVKFQLDYTINNGPIATLATWHEIYDEQFRTVEVDLSGLRGQNVSFILTVLANGSASGDQAQWLAPRIFDSDRTTDME